MASTSVSSLIDKTRASVARSPSRDRKSTRLNSSHTVISYAVFCLKKKKKEKHLVFDDMIMTEEKQARRIERDDVNETRLFITKYLYSAQCWSAANEPVHTLDRDQR